MREDKICFIICANHAMYLDECIRYIHRLTVPEGMEVEIVEIADAVSMTAGYNEGMQATNAKYKVYLHQDVFLTNPYFIEDLLKIFHADQSIGMIGMVGTPQMPPDGVMWNAFRYFYTDFPEQEERYSIERDGWNAVEAVDGLLIATAYDLPWREDLFDGWDFYDVSQSFEFRKSGYQVVVPVQRSRWYVHDDKRCLNLWNYNRYRKLFVEKYLQG
ncbi:MAG: glycosyltransferase family protein [Eubacterium sp.]|nr:glycosyltransferase family protein [Eubacterium sp.]